MRTIFITEELSQLLAGAIVVGLLATIVLAILAISQIRRSQGRYRGYGLAIFPLAMCPFLMLLFGIACSSRVQHTEESYNIGEPSMPVIDAPLPVPPEIVPSQPITPPPPVPNGWDPSSLPPGVSNLVYGVRGLFPQGTTFYPPVRLPDGKLPAFGPVIERTLEAGAGGSGSDIWFNLATGQSVVDTYDPNAKDPNDDEEARQWRIRMGADVAAVLNRQPTGLAGVDMAAMRVTDSEWDTALAVGIVAPMSESQTEDHVLMKFEAPSTYFFKTRTGVMGILQITSFSSSPPGLNFRYKLVEPSSNSNTNLPPIGVSRPVLSSTAVSPTVHADLQARFTAASSMTAFMDRDAAMAGIAEDAARAGDAMVVKEALNRITSFAARDNAAASSVRDLLKQGQHTDAYDAAQLITNFSTRDEVLAEIAKESAKAGDPVVTKEALRRITNFATRDDATIESMRLLIKAGLRTDALEVTRNITDFSKRDQALRELAQ